MTVELNGLLAVWTDIDKDFIPAFRKWHSGEHVALRLTAPGWYVGHRHSGLGGAPDFFISFETRDASDLSSTAYQQSLNNPDAETREALTHYQHTVRTIYRLRHTAGKTLPTDAPYYLTLRFDAHAGEDTAALVRQVGEEHLPEVCRIPGVLRARLYEVDDEISHIKSAEQKLHGAKPGEQRFLTTYELAAPDIPKSKSWQDAFPADVASNMKIRHQELFALEFTMYSPTMRSQCP